MKTLEHIKITINHEECPFSELNYLLDLNFLDFKNSELNECEVYFNGKYNKKVRNITNIDVLESNNNSLRIAYKDGIFEEILKCGILQGINVYKKGDVEVIGIEEIFTCPMESFLCSTQNPEKLYFKINEYKSDYLIFQKIKDFSEIKKFVHSKYNIFPSKGTII